MPDSQINPPTPFLFRLRTKLMLLFLALVLVPLVVIGWISVKTTENLVTDMVLGQLDNVAADKVSLLEHWLEERKADMAVIAGTDILRSMDRDKILPYLRLIQEHYKVYKDFIVESAEGGVVCSTGLSPSHMGLKDHGKTDMSMSDIGRVDDEKESSFTICVPVLHEDGQRLGTIHGRVGTKKIVNFILFVSLGKTGECYLVDREGRFLAHRDPSRILSENITRTGSFTTIFEKRDKRKAYLDYRGIEVLGTSRNVTGTHWYIVVEQDLKEVFEDSNKLKLIVFFTVCLGLASAMTLTWIVSRHIVKPIRSLSRHAAAFADSRFDETGFDRTIRNVTRTDEIGMLTRSFTHMVDRLRERQSDLELKVERKEAELKETDSMLRKTRVIAEQSEKFAAMGRMGAAVAHEIRTPLTSLKLYLESVENQVGPGPDDTEDYRIAMGQIRRMEGTINRFLDYAKPRDLIMSPVDVASLLEDVLLMVKPLANRQECSLKVHVERNLPPVTGDRKRLAEALINLVVNAIESLETHGEVSLSVTLESEPPAPSLLIRVADTGHGMSEDRIAHVFEPFFTTKASGTGLGLALVLQTVKSHDGAIDVKSTPGKGTTFFLHLPCAGGQPHGNP